MTYARKLQHNFSSFKVAPFISNWTTRNDVGGNVSNGGCLIPTSGASGWPFGRGDLITFAEFVGNNSATLPTEVIPTNFTKMGSVTLTDASSRGCRLVLSYKIADGTEFGGSSRIEGMAIPATNALSSYRASMCRVYYMSHPLGPSVSVGTAVTAANAAAIGPVTIQASPLPMIPASGKGGFFQFMATQCNGSPSDATYTVTPLKGTEYVTYPNLFTKAQECGQGAGFGPANVRIFSNFYAHNDPTYADMSVSVADTGAGQMAVGACLLMR